MASQHLERLKTFMPPLNPPPENEVNWKMAEEVFGLSFPLDFKQFVFTYGNVIWCDLFRAIYPETSSREACEKSREDLIETLTHICSDRLYDEAGNIVNIPAYPSPGGLLPCLTDTNTAFMCWRTVGAPHEWTLLKYSSGNLFMFPMDLTQLICDWIERKPPADKAWGEFFLKPERYGIAR